MTRIAKQIVVGKPVAVVLAFARDWRNIPRYLDYVQSVQPLSGKTEGVGAKYFVNLTFLGRRMHSDWETLAYDETAGWTFKAPLAGVEARKVWRFESVDPGSTRVSFTLEYDPRPPIIAPLLDVLVLRRQWSQIYERGLQNLKRIVESGPASEGDS